MSSARSILVLGAGELGMPVIRNLASLTSSQPYPVTVSVLLRPSTILNPPDYRSAEITELKHLNINLVGADVNASASSELVELFRSFHTVIDCSGYGRPKGGQLKIANAVLAAGVKRYYPWQFGVDYDLIGRGSGQDLFDEQLDLRGLLRSQSATKWVIVSTGMFISFLFQPWFGAVETPEVGEKGSVTVRALGSWENAVSVTSPEDIGRLTARVVFDDSIAGQIVYSAGDTVSYGRLADMIAGNSGQKVKREVWTIEDLQEQLRNDPENKVVKYRLVFAAGKGVSWRMEDTINHQWNMELTDVKGWMEEHLDLR